MAELIFGLHAVTAALRAGSLGQLWADRQRQDARLRRLLDEAAAAGVTVHEADKATLARLSHGARHQGVVAEPLAASHAPRPRELDSLLDDTPEPLLLVLDGVQDPHNLGACLRSADAAGVHAVIAPGDRAVGLTPTVRKVASGAAETVAFYPVTNLARQLRELQQRGIWIVGTADDTGDSLYDCDLRGPLALVMGAEERGLRRLTREYCDRLVRIPMAGSVSSLNVSVATGVVLFEAVRQRRVTHNDQNKSPATQ